MSDIMKDIDRALADISSIRNQIAAGTMFRGFGPAVIAGTGGLAVVAATAQTIWPNLLADDPATFLACWVAVAAISAGFIGIEMLARARRHHAGLADTMILNAVEQFLPAGFAGAAVAYVLFKFAPATLWLLPGFWQILIALGIFASARSLPRLIPVVGGWYFVAGVCVLIVASFSQSLDPWMMGGPFAFGQLLMAAILHLDAGEPYDEE